MKTPKQTTSQNPAKGMASWQPMRTHAEATAFFIQGQPKNKIQDGENDCLAEFLQAAKFVLENMRTFTVQDFYRLTAWKDLDAQTVHKLFIAWSDQMTADGRLRRTAGIYDHESFEVL